MEGRSGGEGVEGFQKNSKINKRGDVYLALKSKYAILEQLSAFFQKYFPLDSQGYLKPSCYFQVLRNLIESFAGFLIYFCVKK